MKRPIIIAVAGGSASGKTTVVNEIKEALEGEDIIIIKHDDYYKDQSHLSLEERKKKLIEAKKEIYSGIDIITFNEDWNWSSDEKKISELFDIIEKGYSEWKATE